MRVDEYGQPRGLMQWYDGETGEPVATFNHDNHTPYDPCNAQCSGWKAAPDERVELVNHPSHYGGDTTYEAIKVIEAWDLGFNLGNGVKYISRAGKKDKARTVEDLKKAVWYLEREIKKLEG